MNKKEECALVKPKPFADPNEVVLNCCRELAKGAASRGMCYVCVCSTTSVLVIELYHTLNYTIHS